MNEENIYAKALKKWGEDLQIIVAIEEMSELTKELTKYLRNKDKDMQNTAQEIADVEIMLAQLKFIFDNHKYVEIHKKSKLQRIKRIVEDDTK